MLNEIKITDVGNFKIGNAQDSEAGTGCTVVLFEQGAPAGLDVRGGGPASRESELLKPLAAADVIHAILLSGGSAFGLDAAGGVMQYLEEKGCGLDVGVIKVPLVCQSSLFDLPVGNPDVRPDKAMGYAACKAAEKGNFCEGNYGAGTGATVGKTRGMEYCMKSGVGCYAVQIGPLRVGAVVAVNALGDVFDYKTGNKIAGVRGEEGALAENDLYAMYETAVNAVADIAGKDADADDPASAAAGDPTSTAAGDPTSAAAGDPTADAAGDPTSADTDKNPLNTTLGIVLTNARFTKAQLCKIASVAQDGCARSVRPVHTSMDGDSIYAVSVGDIPADPDIVSTLAAQVTSEAIIRAVQSADSAYGIPGAAD